LLAVVAIVVGVLGTSIIVTLATFVSPAYILGHEKTVVTASKLKKLRELKGIAQKS